jgi:PAS domain S-box-containing protein
MSAKEPGARPGDPAGGPGAEPSGPKGSSAFPPLPPSEARLRLLIENAPSGIALHQVEVDASGRPVDYVFLEVNAAFEEQTGLVRDAILGRRVTEVLPGIERDAADWIGTYGRVALTGEPVRFEQYSDALRRWYDVKAYSPARGYFAVIFHDVTAQVEARSTLERFMAILGHDLRQPMSVVRGSVETLLRHAVPDPRPALQRCVRAVASMDSLVGTLLDTARVRLGQGIPVVPAATDAANLCHRAVEDALAAMPGNQIQVEVAGPIPVNWDRDRLAQALGNLIANAVEHGSGSRPVRVSARLDGEDVEVAVSNDGPSLAPEAIPALFEPFKLSPARGARGGLGLGLYIVREIARAHGGTIAVASHAAETTFTLRLPRSAPGREGGPGARSVRTAS